MGYVHLLCFQILILSVTCGDHISKSVGQKAWPTLDSEESPIDIQTPLLRLLTSHCNGAGCQSLASHVLWYIIRCLLHNVVFKFTTIIYVLLTCHMTQLNTMSCVLCSESDIQIGFQYAKCYLLMSGWNASMKRTTPQM